MNTECTFADFQRRCNGVRQSLVAFARKMIDIQDNAPEDIDPSPREAGRPETEIGHARKKLREVQVDPEP